MELNDGALPLTRGQLDIWLAQETGHSGTEWQLGLFVRIEGPVEPDLLEQAISQALQEAEPVRAAFFEVDGQVFQRVIDYRDVELATLAALAAELRVRRNYPYAGKGDGLTSRLRVCFAQSDYVGIELEVNQGIVFAAGRRWTALRRMLVDSLRTACAA
jgi:hypothetical protein